MNPLLQQIKQVTRTITKHTKPGDFLIIGLILILTVFIVCFYAMIPQEHKYVIISQDNHIIRQIPLDGQTKTTITVDGSYQNTIEINGDQVGFISSSCPNHLCVQTGWISKAGQSAACLPNKVLIQIQSNQEQQIDGITGKLVTAPEGGICE